MNIKPLLDRVLIEPIEEEKNKSGIIIPDTVKEKLCTGTVLEIGPGVNDQPVMLKKGDTVIYGKYAGTEIEIDKKIYRIMRESDIIAIL